MALAFPMISRTMYLQSLCNKYGDFRVAKSFVNKQGDTIWSKHRSVLQCWHSDFGLKFLASANHRQILPVEIILDYDFKLSKLSMLLLKQELKNRGYGYKAYHTGSKGIHVHIIDISLAFMGRYQRELRREEIIIQCGAELMKKSDKCMISLEKYAPHWKSGKMPTELRL